MCHKTGKRPTAWSPGSKWIETCQPEARTGAAKGESAAALVELLSSSWTAQNAECQIVEDPENAVQLKGFTGWEPPCFHDVWKHAENEEKMPIYNGKAFQAIAQIHSAITPTAALEQ